MTIKGRLLSSTAIVKRFQTEKKIEVHLEWQAPRSVRISQPYVVLEKHSGGAIRPSKRYDDICIRFDTIPACDGQTRDDSNSRAIRSVARVTRNSAVADKPARRVYKSLKVTKHSTIPYVRHSFLFCSSNVTLSLRHAVFTIFDFKNAVNLKTALGVRQGHCKYHPSIERIRLPINVL